MLKNKILHIKKVISLKNKSIIFTVLTGIGILLSCYSLPISDLKTIIPRELYLKYYRGEIISLIGSNILILTIIWQSLVYEYKDYPILKKISIIVGLVLLDIFAIFIL